MNDAKRKRGRPADPRVRQQLAREVLLLAVDEEREVAGGRAPFGKKFMTRPMKDLHRQVAAKTGRSLRYVELAWAEFAGFARQELGRQLAARLDVDDVFRQRDDIKQRMLDAVTPARPSRRKRRT